MLLQKIGLRGMNEVTPAGWGFACRAIAAVKMPQAN